MIGICYLAASAEDSTIASSTRWQPIKRNWTFSPPWSYWGLDRLDKGKVKNNLCDDLRLADNL